MENEKMQARNGNECFVGDVDRSMAHYGGFCYMTQADGLVSRTRQDAILRQARQASVQQRNRIAVFNLQGKCICVYDSRSLNTIMDDSAESLQD